jgi:hypothetical protein
MAEPLLMITHELFVLLDFGFTTLHTLQHAAYHERECLFLTQNCYTHVPCNALLWRSRRRRSRQTRDRPNWAQGHAGKRGRGGSHKNRHSGGAVQRSPPKPAPSALAARWAAWQRGSLPTSAQVSDDGQRPRATSRSILADGDAQTPGTTHSRPSFPFSTQRTGSQHRPCACPSTRCPSWRLRP